ncbi:MAG: inorganic phosphate transporter [Chlamydiia bacterium]|nr:inorganic phosphate transporter [Chlamydiia bacterium]
MSISIIIFFISILSGIYVTWSIGANDVANTIAAAIGSKSISWRNAIILASFGELLGAVVLGNKVVSTIATEILPLSNLATDYDKISTMFAVIISTCLWVQFSSMKAMPVSTTHAIVSAIVGIGIFYYGHTSLNWGTIKYISLAWTISPFVCCIIAILLFNACKNYILESDNPDVKSKILVFSIIYIIPTLIVAKIFYNSHPVIYSLVCIAILSIIIFLYMRTEHFFNNETKDIYKQSKFNQFAYKIGIKDNQNTEDVRSLFQDIVLKSSLKTSKDHSTISKKNIKSNNILKIGQITSSFLSSVAHGSNDVSNGIAPVAVIIWVLYGTTDKLSIPIWLLCVGGIGIVTGIVTMGKNVVNTLGSNLISISPFKGFVIQTSTFITVITCSLIGIPVSTSHAILGGIMGTHLSNHNRAINITTIYKILFAWIITVPICMLTGIIMRALIDYTIGIILYTYRIL